MKKYHNKESAIIGHGWIGAGYDPLDWVIPASLRINSMGTDLCFELGILCFRAYLIFCWG
jgi:hypothetical protein